MSSPFQASVLRKHLNAIDGHACKEAYDRLQAHFGDRSMQDTILGMKEEEYQYGFLEDLFVKVLGYTLKPQQNYNLEAEKKNPANSKKADGAILNDLGDVHCVIELKGTDTIDLNRVEAQGFGYLNANPGCRYLVTSNFARLRFYLGDTTAYLEWDLFNLSYDDFRTLWLCLERQSLLADRPMKVREESTVKEEEITKELYRDYSAFKRELFAHLRENHPQVSPLRLFQLTQKLLDRLLFVFFGEDKGLLPPNTASKPIGDFDKLREIDAGQPLYQLLIKYFNYIDTGIKRKDFEIPAYNGGLFAPDPELDALEIPDPILRKHLLKLTAYKFDSEVDVNILGHIFEHSLNEIEEVQAELRGEAVDKSKTKRKKDGVFYTPRYITKYIVENTVGRLCTEKRSELGIDEQDYARGKKRRKKATIVALRQNLETYRAWLLDLKICDPACGSGAFLNEALNFLIAEHENVSELERQLFDSALRFDPGPSILENNLYGVDINDEAVEIARLSLWLRTAQKGRKLTDLSGRIKVGNSLIEDPAVAGDKAFVWAEEFPEVFGEGTRGGFDVVVGNPPYVRMELISVNEKRILSEYLAHDGRADLYVYFFELALKISNFSGKVSFITSSKWTTANYGKPLIKLLQKETTCQSFINFKDSNVFPGIVAYPSIFTFEKIELIEKYEAKLFVISDEDDYTKFGSGTFEWVYLDQSRLFLVAQTWSANSDEKLSILIGRLCEEHTNLKNMNIHPCTGIVTGANKVYLHDIDQNLVSKTKRMILGRDIDRYAKPIQSTKAIFPYIKSKENNLILPLGKIDATGWPELVNEKEILSSRAVISTGIPKGTHVYWEYQQVKTDFDYGGKYIVYPDISKGVNFTLAHNSLFNKTAFGIPTDNKNLLAVLNSNLCKVILSAVSTKARGGYIRVQHQFLLNLPIPTKIDSLGVSVQVEKIMSFVESKINCFDSFLRLLQRNFPTLEKLSKKLQDWPSLDYAEFVNELNKALKKAKQPKLSLSQELEWESVFEEKRKEVLALRAEITKLDREIDVAVYRLYGLTWEEVWLWTVRHRSG
jgi:hypothetical protein